MKVYIPHAYTENSINGKYLFCRRLSLELMKLGVEIVKTRTQKHDISFNLAKAKESNSRKRIIRLDGVCHDKLMNYKKGNKETSKALFASDAVVYQSNFSKRLCDTFLGKFKGHSEIISNGASLSYYQSIEPYRDRRYSHTFLTASRWRPHKRLRDIIESYLLSGVKDSCLYIAGDTKKSGLSKKETKRYSSLSNIKFLGVLQQSELSRYLVSSSSFIHLCWFDNCPNAVIEAVCAGVPVVCNNVGGTREIVSKSSGIICNVDKAYNFKPCDLYHPPSIDRDVIAQSIKDAIKEKRELCADFDIKVIAEQYMRFFEKVLKK